MALGPIELNMMVGRAQDVSAIKQNEDLRPMTEQTAFQNQMEKAEKELESVKIEDEVSDVVCDQCGRQMVIKYGPHGRFLACPGFPECRNTKPYYEKIGVSCPKCGKDVVLKKTQKGRKYYGCIDNPECDFMSWQKPSAKKCPVCGSYMVEKGNKIVCSETTCGYVEQKSKED